MSFILDALKKAESERNRRVAPVLMDARIAPPRRGLPAWAWVLGAVLLVNLGLLGWILWRAPTQGAAAQRTSQATGTGGQAAGGSTTSATPVSQAAPAAPAVAAGPPAQAADAPAAPPVVPGPAAGGPRNAPALPGIAAASPPMTATPSAADFEALPTLYELRAAGVNLPELQLHLHAYAPAPAQRYVLLDAQRLREGEYTPHGVKVERITPTGVVLEAMGRRFRLDSGG